MYNALPSQRPRYASTSANLHQRQKKNAQGLTLPASDTSAHQSPIPFYGCVVVRIGEYATRRWKVDTTIAYDPIKSQMQRHRFPNVSLLPSRTRQTYNKLTNIHVATHQAKLDLRLAIAIVGREIEIRIPRSIHTRTSQNIDLRSPANSHARG